MRKIKFMLVFLAACLTFFAVTAQTKNTTKIKTSKTQTTATPATATPTDPNAPATPAPDVDARGYVLMDASSGKILAAKNPNTQMQPASLTKVMTMYVISETLKNGKIHLNDNVPISRDAWRTGGSRMFIQVGTQIPVQTLIDGIVVVSGNDAAVAMAEYIGGTQQNFVAMMNQAANQLGMKNSHFMDVNGLPAPNHFTTPLDLAVLARALIAQFPDYYKAWYAQKWFEYNKIKQPNRNRLLWQDSSVDGIKTGHTDAAGYCLMASAQRNNMRLISVVMGSSSSINRVKATQALLNWGFRNFSSHQLYPANQALAQARIWFGTHKTVPLGLTQGLYVVVPNGQYKNLKAYLTMNSEAQAPVQKGQQFGNIQVTLNDQPLMTVPVVALENNPRGNVLERVTDHIMLMFHKNTDTKKTV